MTTPLTSFGSGSRPSRFDTAWAAGRALSQEDLILHALGT